MKIIKKISGDKLISAIIVFLVGWFSVLPVEMAEFDLPFFISRISVVHGIFLHESIFIIYVFFHVVFFKKDFSIGLGHSKPVMRLTLIIFLLGTYTIISNLSNIIFGYEQPLTKIAEGFRLYVVAIFVVYVYNWSKKYGGLFICKNYLFGFILSGSLHLYFSAHFMFRELGGLPGLIGQNGPGPGFALGLLFSAVLIHFTKSRNDLVFVVISLPIAAYGVAVSYSKTSMLIGFISFIALSFGLIKKISIKNFPRVFLVSFISFCIIVINFKDELGSFANGAQIYYDYKFGADVIKDNESTAERLSYFSTTAKILFNNPFLGAGTGGFYEAVKHVAPEALQFEDSTNDGSANPHNSFLYYTASSGFIGMALVLFLFFYINMMVFRATKRELMKLCVLPLIFLAFLIYGFTLSSLFNTMYMYIFYIITFDLLRRDRSLN